MLGEKEVHEYLSTVCKNKFILKKSGEGVIKLLGRCQKKSDSLEYTIMVINSNNSRTFPNTSKPNVTRLEVSICYFPYI